MKTKIILASLLVLGVKGYSQNKSALVLRGGVNFANVSVTKDGRIDDAKTLTSFQVGVMGDIPLASVLSLQPGLIFSGKGTKSQSGQTSDANYFRATTSPYYLEVPVNVVFKIPTSDKSSVFIGAGVYAAMGIAGKNKTDGKFLGVAFSSERNIRFSNDDPTTNYEEGAGFGIMKRFDYGLNALAGLEADKVVVTISYGYGLAKLQSGTNNTADDKNKHRVLSATIGFKL